MNATSVTAQVGVHTAIIPVHAEVDGVTRQMLGTLCTTNRRIVPMAAACGGNRDRAVVGRNTLHKRNERSIETRRRCNPANATAGQTLLRRAGIVETIVQGRVLFASCLAG